MKLLLDENIPFSVAARVSQHDIKVRHVLQTHLSGATDEAIFEYACANKLTIVTFDKDFLGDKFFHQPHYGIIFLKPSGKNSDKLVDSILKILRTYSSLKDKTVMV